MDVLGGSDNELPTADDVVGVDSGDDEVTTHAGDDVLLPPAAVVTVFA